VSTSEVARLASDIASQFAHQPIEVAAVSTANHMLMFWDPRMRQQLLDLVSAGDNDLDAVVVAAAARLRAPGTS
jgi:formate dehydrogenase subunit delta